MTALERSLTAAYREIRPTSDFERALLSALRSEAGSYVRVVEAEEIFSEGNEASRGAGIRLIAILGSCAGVAAVAGSVWYRNRHPRRAVA